ncbi:MAG: DUF2177 family protein [Hyphomicrobiaceae bacterium]
MKTIATSYVSAAICMLILDAIWLMVSAPRLYRPLLGDLLADDFRLAPAVAFYVLYVAGIVILAVLPAIDVGKWQTAAISGAVLGLVAYGTYDLTNQATLRTWPALLTAIDLTWGAVLTSVTATAGYFGAAMVRG